MNTAVVTCTNKANSSLLDKQPEIHCSTEHVVIGGGLVVVTTIELVIEPCPPPLNRTVLTCKTSLKSNSKS